MTTVVQNYAAAATNRTTAGWKWVDTANATGTADHVYATSSIRHDVGVVHQTTMLYWSQYNFALPPEAFIEGIEVTVGRASVSEVSDVYVAIIAKDGVVVQEFPGTNNPNFWSQFLGEEVTYGGPTDMWGRSDWSAGDINDPNFGFGLVALGNPVMDAVAEADFCRITLYFHRQSDLVGSGGGVLSGSADIAPGVSASGASGVAAGGRASFTDSVVGGPAGALAAGSADSQYGLVGAGGVIAGGETFVPPFVASGGAVVGGAADVWVEYDPLSRPPDSWGFYCTPWQVVPENFAPRIACCEVRLEIPLDSEIGVLHFTIAHDFQFLTDADFAGSAPRGQNAPDRIILDGNYSLTSPITGTANVSPVQIANIRRGLWYVQLENEHVNAAVRGQLADNPPMLGGTAVVGVTRVMPTSGGVVVAGSAVQSLNFSPSGGVFGAGSAPSAILIFGSGGVRVAGSAVRLVVFGYPISGGVYGDGSAISGFSYRYTASGGAYGAGKATPGIQPLSFLGGAFGAGTALRSDNPSVSGGAYGGGSIVLQQTYADHTGSGPGGIGGVRIFGTWPPEKLKAYYTQQHRNYALLMKTPNIYNTPKPKRGIIRTEPFPPAAVVASLADSPFVQRVPHGWCDLGEPCGECCAYLPKVVQKRQGRFLPPKTGTTPAVEDQLASAGG